MKAYRTTVFTTNEERCARLQDVMTKDFSSYEEALVFGANLICKMYGRRPEMLWDFSVETLS